MKTPEEIKKGLECCRNVWVNDRWKNCDSTCPYQTEQSYCKNALHHDALAYIQQLEANNKRYHQENTEMYAEMCMLREKVHRLEAERDAAVKDLGVTRDCKVCKHYGCRACDEPCKHCGIAQPFWEWRGLPEPPEENGGKENDCK